MPHPSGVLWAGPLFDRGGFGNVCRNYVRALLSADIPVRTFNLGHLHPEIDPLAAAVMRDCSEAKVGDTPFAVAQCFPTLLPDVRFQNVVGKANATLFETHSIPFGWAPLSREVDQVWVPSRFNESTYSQAGVPQEKIRVIPIPADCEYFTPGHPRVPIPGATGFIFLYVFSFGWRKGFDLLLRAYLEEFSSHDDVTLILKVYRGNPRVPDLEEAVLSSVKPGLNPRAPAAPRVLVHAGSIPQDQLRSFYSGCDLYVSTDRAKGWDMPCMEAMAMGKATAAIDWSGSTEFMTSENSLLIRPTKTLEDVDPRLSEANAFYTGQKWASVEVAEVRRVLRLAFEDRRQLKEKGERAAEDIRQNFSFERIGDRFRQVLESYEVTRSMVTASPRVSVSWKRKLKRVLGNSLRALFPSLRS